MAAGAFPQVLGATVERVGKAGSAFDQPSGPRVDSDHGFCANPLWRAPRIHRELRKLGIEVSERTVSRVLRTVERPPSQTWKTFLQNHIGENRRD